MARKAKKQEPEHPRITELVIASAMASIDKQIAILKTHGCTVEFHVQKPMTSEEIKELHN